MSDSPVSPLLTARTVSDRLGVSPATVLRWTREGKLTGIRLPSGALRFREEQIEDYLAAWSTGGAVGGVVSLVSVVTDEEDTG